jgi:post-segregation antitoxin (ccd killing protein)
MENLYRQAKDQAEKMQHTIQRLANDIKTLELKISILDKTALSCEQECKRTEQQKCKNLLIKRWIRTVEWLSEFIIIYIN